MPGKPLSEVIQKRMLTMSIRSAKTVYALLILAAVSFVFPLALSAQDLADGRINVVHHFGGDALYCVDRDNHPTGQYSDDGLGGMRLLNSSGSELWFLPAADIAAAVEAARTSGGGVLAGSGQGTYGPVWLYTYIDTTDNVKFVFSGYDEHSKINSLEFTYCEQVGPIGGPDEPDEPDEPSCPAGTSPDGDGLSGPIPGCTCDGDGQVWVEIEQGCFLAFSDRNLKQDIAAVDPQRILEMVASLPVSEWSYRSNATVRHVGPMAQDFMSTFGLGEDPTRINLIDANGINLAATQGLYQLAAEQQAQIQALETRNNITLLLAVGATLLAGLTSAVILRKLRR